VAAGTVGLGALNRDRIIKLAARHRLPAIYLCPPNTASPSSALSSPTWMATVMTPGSRDRVSMQQPSPILVYSIYRSDIPRFERLLAHALPDVSIHCASSLEEAAPYLD